MAITRAQIARELYIKGGVVNPDGRRGFGGGADMGTVSSGGFSANTGLSGGYQGGPKGGYGGGGNDNKVTGDDYRRSKKEFEDKLKADNAQKAAVEEAARKKALEDIKKQTIIGTNKLTPNYFDRAVNKAKTLNTNIRNKLIEGFIDRTVYDNLYNAGIYGEDETDLLGMGIPSLTGIATRALRTINPPADVKAMDVDSIRELGLTGQIPSDMSKSQLSAMQDLRRNLENKAELESQGMTQSRFEELYPSTVMTNQDRGDGGQTYIPPVLTPYQEDVVEEVDPNSLQGLLANRIAYRFMANGGRAGYQQGGEIMPRLNQLGSGLSSAEQTLQEINQRLQSAESTLGEGGGNTAPIGSGPMQLAGGATQQPAGLNTKNQLGYASFEDMMKNRIQSDVPNFFTDLQGVQRTPDGGLYNASNFQSSLGGSMTSGTAGGPMQSPLATAIGLASGGRVGLMGGGMPYEGGIMDLESARQMYGLGKLVKKATGAISKIMKSPVGKAALLAGGAGLFGYGPAKELFASGKGLAFKEMLGKGILKKGATDFTLANLSPFKTIGLASLASGLLASQDEEDEVQPYYRGPGLDIDAIRRDPYGTKGPAFGFYAKGGDVKEPVAKDTMPLLDMNGMEKDYRADGGFVPIGRMERADDVPARLSKNEFVFTADAVRNAGEGDIDKGAEVMYNVMKNLEAGGNISEESQGLNGARNMFQTSKRLEEVL